MGHCRGLWMILALLVAGCGGRQGDAPFVGTPTGVALSPLDAPASTSRRLLAGMYVDTDPNGTAAQVYRLYRAAFNRAADPSGLGFWVGQIEVMRRSLQDVAAGFVASAEFATAYGALDDTQFVTLLYSNVLHREPDAGGLAFHVGNLANGVPRTYVLLEFSESAENKAQTASVIAAGVTFTPWPNGRVYLTDGNYFETDPSGTAAKVYRLYRAALGRAADVGGLGFHVGTIEHAGLSLLQVAQNFMGSPEFAQNYGTLDNTAFVTQLYANVLNRAPDPGGLAFHVGNLGNGVSRAQVLLDFSESPENKANTLLPVFAGLRFQPWPSGPSMPAIAAPTGVTGTAATGSPLAGVTVTLKDSANRSSTAVTEADGRYRIDTSGLSPPFMLRASPPASPALYSVSTSASASATINITPVTDSIVRSWYMLRNEQVDAAFAAADTMPAPNAQQVRSITQTFSPVMQLVLSTHGVALADSTELISLPFLANGSGVDAALDNTQVMLRTGGMDLAITAGSASQNTAVEVDAGSGTITASSTTTQGQAASTSVVSTVVPVQPAQSSALDAIQSLLSSASALVASRNGAVTAADLTPFHDPDLLHEGRDRASYVAETAADLAGIESVAFTIARVIALDAGAGTAELLLHVTLAGNGESGTDTETFHFRKVGHSWLFSGDGRIARVNVQAEARRDQGTFQNSGPSVNFDVRAPKDTVTAVSASSSFAIPAFQRSATEVQEDGSQLDVFVVNTGTLAAPLPAAGTPVTLTLSRSAGGVAQYTVPINAWTTELISITSPTSTSLAAGPLTVQWTRPSTYAVAKVGVSVLVFTGNPSDVNAFQCVDGADPPPTASSAQVQVPDTCNGLPVQYININVSTDGPNGERSQVILFATRSP